MDNGRRVRGFFSSRTDEFQVIRLVGDGLVAKASYDFALFEEEHARHLMAVFLNAPDSVFAQSA
jgi:hypothetical protein